MEDLRSTKNDDSLDIATKCWKRVMDNANKIGYREGIQDGANSALQEGFDIGYKDGFETAFILGRYKSLSTFLSPNTKHPTDIAVTLEKTKRGACRICSMESQNEASGIYQGAPFSKILSDHREHSAKVINRLCEYFQPIVEESNGIDLPSK